MAVAGSHRSIPDIFTDVVAQLTTLLRKEGQLARAEVSENISKAVAGVGFIIGGAVLLIPALVVLLQAAVTALTAYGVAAHWAALTVGGAVLLIGLVLLFVGMNRVKAENMVPSRTIRQLQQDASAARDQMRESHDLRRAA